jgi:hypothetical protein
VSVLRRMRLAVIAHTILGEPAIGRVSQSATAHRLPAVTASMRLDGRGQGAPVATAARRVAGAGAVGTTQFPVQWAG